MENSEELNDSLPTPGQLLREAREAAGISAREMADRLNWMPSNVAAIEEDRFETLRGPAFVRGYLRAYARLVDVDEDRLLATYDAMLPEGDESNEATASSGGSAGTQTTGISVVVGIVIAAACVAGVWWWQQEDAPPRPQPKIVVKESTSPVLSRPVTEVVTPAVVEADQSTEDLTVDVPTAEEEPDLQQDMVADLAVDEAPPAEELLEPVDAPPAELLEEGMVGIAFSFSGDCWLEVRDGDEQLIYADLRAAGDNLRLDGVPPFTILAGDASALQVFYEGEEVPVRTRPGRDTARFTVGEALQ